MNVGIVGLGRMGFAIAYRLLNADHQVIGLDHSEETRRKASEIGVDVVDNIKDLAEKTDIVWLMVPISQVDTVIRDVKPHLKAGNIIVDGGNSFYKDSQRRAQELSNDGIFFLDCGTSGGIHGQESGFCLMVGGDEATYTKIHSLFAAIAAPGGLGHIGPSGTGHYVKMVHNGIEYGLLQAYGEGFQLFKKGNTYPMPEFVDKFFKGAVIANRNNEKRCDVYWDPDKRMDLMEIEKCGIWGNNYLRLTPCEEKYNLSFRKHLNAAMAQIFEEDTEAAAQSNVKLKIYSKEKKALFGEIVCTLEIACSSDKKQNK